MLHACYMHVMDHMQCLQETAEEEGDAEKSKTLSDKLTELEERADLLDKQRTKGLSAIRYWLAMLVNMKVELHTMQLH